jgi:hypothetical protein
MHASKSFLVVETTSMVLVHIGFSPRLTLKVLGVFFIKIASKQPFKAR